MMKMQSATSLESFRWIPQPVAFSFIRAPAGDLLAACPDAAAFADRMRNETGTRFIDWIDHIRLNRVDSKTARLDQAGQSRSKGAIGSHLENLERNDGFRGFNQEGVNAIITATGPPIHLT
jgi:hypothetical protein